MRIPLPEQYAGALLARLIPAEWPEPSGSDTDFTRRRPSARGEIGLRPRIDATPIDAMQLPRRRRPDFEAGREFHTPSICASRPARAPAAPGVYTFHGRPGDLPLYIGKSVNLRAPAVAPARTRTACCQATAISFEHRGRDRRAAARSQHDQAATAALQPETAPQQAALRAAPGCRYEADRGGPFEGCRLRAHARALRSLCEPACALEGSAALADEHQALPSPCWDWRSQRAARGCFRSMLRQCAGACCGRESLAEHRERLLAALDRTAHRLLAPFRRDRAGRALADRKPGATPCCRSMWCATGATWASAASLDAGAQARPCCRRLRCRRLQDPIAGPLLTGQAETLPLLKAEGARVRQPDQVTGAGLKSTSALCSFHCSAPVFLTVRWQHPAGTGTAPPGPIRSSPRHPMAGVDVHQVMPAPARSLRVATLTTGQAARP